MLVAMKIMFGMIIRSTSAHLSDMIVLENSLKLWIELVKVQNDNAMETCYRIEGFFRKLLFLVEHLKKSNNPRNKD